MHSGPRKNSKRPDSEVEYIYCSKLIFENVRNDNVQDFIMIQDLNYNEHCFWNSNSGSLKTTITTTDFRTYLRASHNELKINNLRFFFYFYFEALNFEVLDLEYEIIIVQDFVVPTF